MLSSWMSWTIQSGWTKVNKGTEKMGLTQIRSHTKDYGSVTDLLNIPSRGMISLLQDSHACVCKPLTFVGPYALGSTPTTSDILSHIILANALLVAYQYQFILYVKIFRHSLSNLPKIIFLTTTSVDWKKDTAIPFHIIFIFLLKENHLIHQSKYLLFLNYLMIYCNKFSVQTLIPIIICTGRYLIEK